MKTLFNKLPTEQKKSIYKDVEQFRNKKQSLDGILTAYKKLFSFYHACYRYTLFQYVLRGEHAVILGNKLYSMFKNTNCHKVPAELFNLPFDAFYIQLPDKNEGVFVANQMKPEGEIGHIQITRTIHKGGNIIHTHLPLKQMTPDKDGIIDPEQVILDRAAEDADQLESSSDEISVIARIVCNTILYMNSVDADIKTEHNKNKSNKKTKRKIRTIKQKLKNNRKKAKTNNTAIIWLGKTLEDDPNIQSIPTGKSNNWSVRRGHWHSFWTGSRTDPETKEPRKGEELVLKWVKPIYRNIVNAPQKQREMRFVK